MKNKNNQIYNELEKMLEIENKSPNTCMRYSKALKEMENHFHGADLSKLSNKQLYEYSEELHKNTNSVRTYNSKIAALRYVYRKVLKRIFIETSLPLKKNNKRSERIIPSQTEMAMIIKNCKDLELLGIILLALGSGLRRTEIASLKIENIIKGRYTISVIGKGQRERKTVIDEITLKVLRKYYVTERKINNEYLFSRKNYAGYIRPDEITRRVRNYVNELNMNYTLHDFRRVFATVMYKAGVDLVTIKRYLGHDSIDTTMKYISLSKYEEKKEVSPIYEIMSKTSIGVSK